MTRRFLPLLVFIALAALLAYGLRLNPSLVPSPLIGKPAPEFSLPTLADGERVITHDALRGRVTMVHVWATWCVTCRAEHPTLMAFAQRGIVPVIGLNYRDERGAALQWLQVLGDPYELTLYDPAGQTGIDWGVYGTPETFIIDRAGIIRYKLVGPLTEAIIETQLVPLVRELEQGT